MGNNVINVNEEMQKMQRCINGVNEFSTLLNEIATTAPLYKRFKRAMTSAIAMTVFVFIAAIVAGSEGSPGVMVFAGVVMIIYYCKCVLGDDPFNFAGIAHVVMGIGIIVTLVGFFAGRTMSFAPFVFILIVWGLVGGCYYSTNYAINEVLDRISRV